MLHGGGRGNQWTVAVVGRQHVVEQYAEEARLIFVLLDDALVQLAVEVDVVQQRITASDAFVGVAPAVGDDASRSGRLRTVGDSRPGVVVAEIIAVGRGVVFPVDGGAAVDAVFEQGVVAPRQAALRGFGAVPEGLLVVAVLRFDVQVAAGAEGSEQNRCSLLETLL